MRCCDYGHDYGCPEYYKVRAGLVGETTYATGTVLNQVALFPGRQEPHLAVEKR
jgi:hypothetical protein